MRAPLPRWAERPVLLMLGFGAACLALVPIAPGEMRAAPDLVYCLVMAWSARRPDSASLFMVLALGLMADLLLSRPLGLGALGLVLAAELTRSRRGPRPFLVEWGIAVMAFALMLAGIVLVLRLSFAVPPESAGLLWHLAATAIAYPFVAAALAWALGSAQRQAGAPR